MRQRLHDVHRAAVRGDYVGKIRVPVDGGRRGRSHQGAAGQNQPVPVENELFTDYTRAPPVDDERVLQAMRIEA